MNELIAAVGRVTGEICPGSVGEVRLPVRGGMEAFLAYAVDPTMTIPNGSRVIVIDQESHRVVRVEPYNR